MRQKCLLHVPQSRRNYFYQNRERCVWQSHFATKFFRVRVRWESVLHQVVQVELPAKNAPLLPLLKLNLKIAAVSF